MEFNKEYIGTVNDVDVAYVLRRKKDSKLMIFISYLLFWQREVFLNRYYTTIGKNVYCPTDTPDKSVLRHELVHVFDSQRHPVWFPFSYLFMLPLVWTMRSRWEKRAYSFQMRELNWYDVEWVKEQFCTSRYLWMWPFPKAIEKWVEQVKSGEYAPIKSVEL